MFEDLGVRLLSKVDYCYLDSFFKSQPKASKALSLSHVHGLLTAVISAPTIIKPNDWTALIIGRDPLFASLLQAEKVMGLLIELYSQIARQLCGEEVFAPLLWNGECSEQPEYSQEQSLQEWCIGYIEGVKLDPLWGTDQSAVAMLTPFFVLAKRESFIGKQDSQGCPITEDTPFLQEYRAHLIDFIEDNYAYWLKEREEEFASMQIKHYQEQPKSNKFKLNSVHSTLH